jgi:hypothetical protein
MRYTERLEALEFAIACVTTVHDGIVKHGGSQMNHQNSAVKCDCNYGVTILRLRDEATTVKCAIEATNIRLNDPNISRVYHGGGRRKKDSILATKVFNAARLYGSGEPVKVVTP